MTLTELILELDAIAADIGGDNEVRVERGGEQTAARLVTFEGSTNETHIIIHG